MNKNKKKELENLKKEREDLVNALKDIKKRNLIKKIKHALNISKYTFKYSYSYFIVTGAIVFLIDILGGGLPLKKDTITKYKYYGLEYSNGKIENYEEKYITRSFLDDALKNSLVVYTPWEKKGEEYIRYKREYNIDSTFDSNIIDTIINKNINKIDQIEVKTEEKRSTNTKQNGDYVIEASLELLDRSDKIIYTEEDKNNTIITLFEIAASLSFGIFVSNFREYNLKAFKKDLKNAKKELNLELEEPMEELIKKTDEKILSLTKGGSYDKH